MEKVKALLRRAAVCLPGTSFNINVVEFLLVWLKTVFFLNVGFLKANIKGLTGKP
jgi:hypothetical protein